MTSFFDLDTYEKDGIPLEEKIKVSKKKLKEWGEKSDIIKMICDDADGVCMVYRMKEKPKSTGYALFDYVTSM